MICNIYIYIYIRRPCPSSSLGRAAPGTTLGVELQNQPLHRPNPSLQRRVAFGMVACKCHWLFQLSGICTELFFPVPRLPPGPFNPFPAASSGLSTCCLANATGFSSCRGSAQSFFFRFQDCLAPSIPSLQRPVAFPPVVLQMPMAFPELFFPLPRLPPGPFKPFPAASSRFWNGCLLMPMALPAVGDLHRAFFSASKTAAWPLQTLPCSVQWPFHLLSCKRQWLCQQSRICTVLFFPIPRPPPGPPCSVLWQMPMVSLVGGDLHRALFSGSNAQTLACTVKWPLERLRAKSQCLFQLSEICTELVFPVPNV